MMRGRRRGTDFGLLMLGFQLVQFGIDRIPPVTLGTIVLNVLAYKYLPYNVRGTCISVHNVWHQWDLKRLIIGALDHGDDIHLYYNMVSLLSKGNSLERRLKSPYFAYILVVFTALTGVTMVAINFIISLLTDNPAYIHQCAVGFSGVIFALKVLTTYYNPPGTQYIMGFIPVPSKWVVWAELVIIQLLVPNASFTGHLAGILVGLAYVRGPLKPIMDMIIPTGPSYSYRSGSSGYGRPTNSRNQSGWQNFGPGFTTGRSPNTTRPFPSAPEDPQHTYQGPDSPDPPGWRFTNTDPCNRANTEPHYRGNTDTRSRTKTEEEQLQETLERSRWDH